jgi:hypothetical protein
LVQTEKPLGINNYGTIPHLIGSRVTLGDKHCHEGQVRIATEKVRDRHDEVIVTEKVDGCLNSRVVVLTDKGNIPIGRIVNQKLPVLVASYNESNQIIEYKRILEYHKQHYNDKWIKVKITSTKQGNHHLVITVTPNHLFYCKRGNDILNVQAIDLKIGDKVFQSADKIDTEAYQIILGGLLGDSSFLHTGPNHHYGFAFGHSLSQEGYFIYKMRLLGGLVHETTRQRGGFEGSKENRRAYSHHTPYVDDLITKNCIVDGKKGITTQWIKQLNPLGLAIWYMDDGSCRFSSMQRPRLHIATNGFPFHQAQMLSDMLRFKFNIDNGVYDYKGATIVCTADGTERFFDLIYPYVPQCMKYKLPPKYKNRACVLEGFFGLYSSQSLIETTVVDIDYNGKVYEGENWQYDLTVEDNHNYFASDILVHNSNVGVALLNGEIIALTRAGYKAETSPYEQHWHWNNWVKSNESRFRYILKEGERIVGEWLMQAHGTRYNLMHEPFVVFDLMKEHDRVSYNELLERTYGFQHPHLLYRGNRPLSIEAALNILGEHGYHGAIDLAEGCVWKIERKGIVDFMCKYVRPDKEDGIYLPEKSKLDPVWNWYPYGYILKEDK